MAYLIPVVNDDPPTLEEMLESGKVLFGNEGDEGSVREGNH